MSRKPDYRNIESDTVSNKLYRKVVYTTPTLQLVLMSLKPNEDIPKEVHHKITQFIRVEAGTGLARVGRTEYKLKDGISIIIPPDTEHYIKNTSRTKDLKLYALYSPPEHAPTRRNTRQPS